MKQSDRRQRKGENKDTKDPLTNKAVKCVSEENQKAKVISTQINAEQKQVG